MPSAIGRLGLGLESVFINQEDFLMHSTSWHMNRQAINAEFNYLSG